MNEFPYGPKHGWHTGLDGALNRPSLFHGKYFHSELPEGRPLSEINEIVDALNTREDEGISVLFTHITKVAS